MTALPLDVLLHLFIPQSALSLHSSVQVLRVDYLGKIFGGATLAGPLFVYFCSRLLRWEFGGRSSGSPDWPGAGQEQRSSTHPGYYCQRRGTRAHAPPGAWVVGAAWRAHGQTNCPSVCPDGRAAWAPSSWGSPGASAGWACGGRSDWSRGAGRGGCERKAGQAGPGRARPVRLEPRALADPDALRPPPRAGSQRRRSRSLA